MPIHYDTQRSTWVFVRYGDVYQILRNHATLSNSRPITFSSGRGSQQIPILNDDPPRHTQLRTLLSRAFNGASVKAVHAWMEASIGELVGQIPMEGADLVRHLANPLPVMVIARMMGVHSAELARFKRWSEAITGLLDGVERTGQRRAAVEIFKFFDTEIKRRRANPLVDLINDLVHAQLGDIRLTDSEIQKLCIVLLVAGNETTTNLISNMCNLLADRPELWHDVAADPDLAGRIVDETLRYESPIQFTSRIATAPTKVGGVDFDVGARLTVCLGAANRDGGEFERPDQFDVSRKLHAHLAFSHGIHYCMGAPLARAEGRLVLLGLRERFDRLRHAARGVRAPSVFLRGFKSLPMRFI